LCLTRHFEAAEVADFFKLSIPGVAVVHVAPAGCRECGSEGKWGRERTG